MSAMLLLKVYSDDPIPAQFVVPLEWKENAYMRGRQFYGHYVVPEGKIPDSIAEFVNYSMIEGSERGGEESRIGAEEYRIDWKIEGNPATR